MEQRGYKYLWECVRETGAARVCGNKCLLTSTVGELIYSAGRQESGGGGGVEGGRDENRVREEGTASKGRREGRGNAWETASGAGVRRGVRRASQCSFPMLCPGRVTMMTEAGHVQ